MKIKHSVYLFLFLFIGPLRIFAQSADGLATKIDVYLTEKFPSREPGGVVLVAKGDELIFRKAYGVANLKTQTKNTPETIFRIGSITKQFTSTAILKLVDAGRISLDDPITKFFPDYPMGEKSITVRHLLNHTSGIKSYTSLPEMVGSKESKEKAYTIDEVISAVKLKPKDFAAGDDYRYNNSGYFLLGAIIEKVTGSTWEKYLQENFFKPLQMTRTYCNDLSIEGDANGYYKSKNTYDDAHIVHPSVSYAAGAIASTVDDLWKWNKAIFNGKVGRTELLETAWQPLILNNGATRQYGFGWQFSGEKDKRAIGHGGTIDGYQSFAWYVPSSKVFVVVLSNNMGSNPGEYTSKILDLIQGNNDALVKVEHKEIKMEAEKFARFEGAYELFPNFVITIKRDGDKLLAQATGQPASQIFPESENKFFYKVVDAQIEFSSDEKGNVNALTLFQNGNKMPGKKK